MWLVSLDSRTDSFLIGVASSSEIYTLSLHDALPICLEVGERFYGYWPIATHLVVEPVRVTERGFYDGARSEEHTSELQSRPHLVCRLLLEKKNTRTQ